MHTSAAWDESGSRNTQNPDGRCPPPVCEMAKQFDVSPATIHVRIEKMKAAEIIEGTEVIVNPKKLGYDVCCFIESTSTPPGITILHWRN